MKKCTKTCDECASCHLKLPNIYDGVEGEASLGQFAVLIQSVPLVCGLDNVNVIQHDNAIIKDGRGVICP